MNSEEFRVIPGYAGYSVSKGGVVKSIERDIELRQYVLDGYLFVDSFRGSATETLPIHRAVALAWVANPNPVLYSIVNHKDGVRVNNWYENLEWTDHSGNNYHAVNSGLRSDNIPCQVRDFVTGLIHEFSSIAQAAEFMGMRKNTSIYQLQPKKFGALIVDRYEFRFAGDATPWFYEQRPERLKPARFMVNVAEPDGSVREVYSTSALLKDYQLYGSPSKAIPALVEHAQQLHSDKKFTLRDSYAEERFRPRRQTETSERLPIRATCLEQTLDFESLTRCAQHFNVDRSSIVSRLNNGTDLDGWTFIQMPL